MEPVERVKKWEVAYRILNQTLGIDYRETSKNNLKRLEQEINASSCAIKPKLQEFEIQIREVFDKSDLVLARGSRNWEAIEKYGWMLSDLGLEEEGIAKTSSTQRVDRKTWGNHDFVFFFFGLRSHLNATTLASKYGTIKFFDPQPLYERGWISLGDWMEFYNAQAIEVPQWSTIGELSTKLVGSKSGDRVQRARETQKHYFFASKEKSMQPRLAVEELFFGPDIKQALACHLILFLRCFCPTPLLVKRLDQPPVETLLNSYLPMIEAKLPRAVSMNTMIGQATATGPSPAATMSAMLSPGSGPGQPAF
jgi:hypothetical protein